MVGGPLPVSTHTDVKHPSTRQPHRTHTHCLPTSSSSPYSVCILQVSHPIVAAPSSRAPAANTAFIFHSSSLSSTAWRARCGSSASLTNGKSTCKRSSLKWTAFTVRVASTTVIAGSAAALATTQLSHPRRPTTKSFIGDTAQSTQFGDVTSQSSAATLPSGDAAATMSTAFPTAAYPWAAIVVNDTCSSRANKRGNGLYRRVLVAGRGHVPHQPRQAGDAPWLHGACRSPTQDAVATHALGQRRRAAAYTGGQGQTAYPRWQNRRMGRRFRGDSALRCATCHRETAFQTRSTHGCCHGECQQSQATPSRWRHG